MAVDTRVVFKQTLLTSLPVTAGGEVRQPVTARV